MSTATGTAAAASGVAAAPNTDITARKAVAAMVSLIVTNSRNPWKMSAGRIGVAVAAK